MKRPKFTCHAGISKAAREQLRREWEADIRRWQQSPGYLKGASIDPTKRDGYPLEIE